MEVIPLRNIRIGELETKFWFIMSKVCDVLFSNNYSEYCIKTARSVLDFVVKAKVMTYKQAKLIMGLMPKNN